MKFVFGLIYEVDSWMSVDERLAQAVDAQKYSSKHVDVLTCPVAEIHTAKSAVTYFENKKVFSM